MATENRYRVQWYRQRENAGARNEEAAGAIDFSFLDSYCQTLYRLLRTFLRYRPFRLSTLDPRLPQEGGEFQILLARHLGDMGARSRSHSRPKRYQQPAKEAPKFGMDYSFLYRYSFFGILQRNVKLGPRHYH